MSLHLGNTASNEKMPWRWRATLRPIDHPKNEVLDFRLQNERIKPTVILKIKIPLLDVTQHTAIVS